MAKREKCMNVVFIKVDCMYIAKRDVTAMDVMVDCYGLDGMDYWVLLDEKDTEGFF